MDPSAPPAAVPPTTGPPTTGHLHFVTGKLAQRALREVLGELAPRLNLQYSISVLPITVAALMTPRWLLRHLVVPAEATAVIVPGHLAEGRAVIETSLGVPVVCGPRDLRQLPEFFGAAAAEAEVLSQHSIEIIAEINHAPRLPLAELLAEAQRLRDAGADVIDIGCEPGERWARIGEAFSALTAVQAGVIEKHEHEMVRNVFRLDDRQIGSLMTPRSEIVYFDVEQPIAGSLQPLIDSDHSRFPVCRGGMGDLIGVITAKRLLKLHLKGETAELADYLLPPVYVPESLTGMKLLEQFRESGVQMVFVVDEYGEVLGLVTLQDLLEAVTGEFRPRDPEDVWAAQREDGSWLLDGLIPVPELKDRLELKSVPEEEKGRYHTLSGMMMWLLGRVPKTADSAVWEGWLLEVVDLDGNRIDKVLAQRLPPMEELPNDDPASAGGD